MWNKSCASTGAGYENSKTETYSGALLALRPTKLKPKNSPPRARSDETHYSHAERLALHPRFF
jgi:hypothetical protein